MNKQRRWAAVLALGLGVAVAPLSCTPTQRGAAIGGATGAAAGAILSRHHRTTRGAVIGGLAGALIGGAIGHTYEYDRLCPTCGRRFHYSKVYCPYDSTPLHQVR